MPEEMSVDRQVMRWLPDDELWAHREALVFWQICSQAMPEATIPFARELFPDDFIHDGHDAAGRVRAWTEMELARLQDEIDFRASGIDRTQK